MPKDDCKVVFLFRQLGYIQTTSVDIPYMQNTGVVIRKINKNSTAAVTVKLTRRRDVSEDVTV